MWCDRLLQGALDTLLMVGVSSLIALLVGIPLAVFLVVALLRLAMRDGPAAGQCGKR